MKQPPDPLEKVIHEALRSLPPRKAPSGLEARVLAEIARRDALPWWCRSWTYWPVGVRWIFLAISAAVCATAIIGCVTLLRGTSFGVVGRILAQPSQTWGAIMTVIHTAVGVGGSLFGLIPAVWLYSGVATITLLYATVFLAGAAAYRTLWQSR